MASLQVQLENRHPMRLAAQFECAAGELIALVGPSGSGKTSLLRAVAGLLRAPELKGQIRVGEESWFDSSRGIRLAPQQRCVGLVFQDYALFPHLSAWENAGIGVCKGADDQGRSDELAGIFGRLGLAGLEQRRPAQLSGGQRQRVALARALLRVSRASRRTGEDARCGVMLLDEPFSAVDAPTRQTLYRELAALRQEVSTPMVLVTHDLSEARRLADRVVILDAGETLQSGTPERVFASPRNARVADLVGIQNHFKGRFLRQDEGGVLLWQDGSGQHSIALKVVDKHRLDDGVAVTWVVAGEHVDVMAPGEAASHDGGDNLIRCELVELLSLGEISVCTLKPVQLEGERLTLNLSSSALRALKAGRGSRLDLRLPMAAIHIMPQRSA